MPYRVRFLTIENPATQGYQDIAPVCAVYEITRPDGSIRELRQPCDKGDGYYTKHGQPVWGWNGSTTLPTLTPSYLCTLGKEDNRLRLHWSLTQGCIVPYGDNEAEVVVG